MFKYALIFLIIYDLFLNSSTVFSLFDRYSTEFKQTRITAYSAR